MKTPSFWYSDKPSLLSGLLSPLAHLYARGALFDKENAEPQEVRAPVICCGNIVAGGSGKTPTALALMKLLKENHVFLSPAFVTRGYRGKIIGPERVDNTRNAVFWGDEALLLAANAPTYVAHNRFDGAETAINAGADAVILDDGLQHYTLTKDVSFAIIDGRMGFGNEKVLPAGPLRLPLEDGIESADAFILIGDDKKYVRGKIPEGKPVFTAHINVRQDADLPHVPYIAFCGIGFPEKFKDTLAEQKIECVDFVAFPDHHAFTEDDLEKLAMQALEKKARLITTEKDYVRLPYFAKKQLIDVLPIEIIFDELSPLIDFIKAKTKPKFIP